MILINFSLDHLLIQNISKKKKVSLRNLERVFPKLLYELYVIYKFKKVFLINWPWSFTTLRIVCSCLNIFNKLLIWKLSFYEISKIELYKYLYNQNILNRYWMIFIWQRKNFWKYDFKFWNYEKIVFSDNILDCDNVFFDNIEKFRLNKKLSNKIINIWLKQNYIQLKINNKKKYVNIKNDLEKIWFQQKKILLPNYMIEPTIGKFI